MNNDSPEHPGNDLSQQAEFYQSWTRILGKLAHDLTGDLAMMRQKNAILVGMLPSLLKGYHLAVENNLMKSAVKEKHLNALGDLNLDSHIADMIEQIRLLNVYCGQMFLNSQDILQLSAMDCLNEGLRQYLFENDRCQNVIRIENGYDFQFKCSPLFIYSLLNNFLANGVRSIEKAGKGVITMWVSQEGHYNTLNFKDTGLGMVDDERLRVFDRFLSKREGRIIPGLGFCRTAIRYAGGDVTCHSVEGEYTHFIVTFPINA